jgi:hypothetical protein
LKEASLSFCPFGSTWLLMVRLAKQTTITQPAFNFFIKMKMVIFVFIVVVAAHACFVVPVDGVTGAARHIVFATCLAIVVHVTHGASITWLYFLLFFCKFFMVCFVVDLNVVVAGDLRHEFAQFA